MARPINLFQGPAPQAMSMMGQGFIEAGANIGRTLQQGGAALGEGIAKGIESVAGAMKQSSSAKAANNVTKSILGDESMFKMFFPEGTEEQRKNMLSSFNETIVRDGQMGGLQFTSQIMGPFLEQQRLGQQFQKQMQLAGMHEAAATQRSAMALERQREEEIAKMLFGSSKPKASQPVEPLEQAPSRMFSPGTLGDRIKMSIGVQ